VVLTLVVIPPPVGCHCSWWMMMSTCCLPNPSQLDSVDSDFSFLMRGSKNMFKLKL
jgi:hypothetical protein